MGQSTTIGRIGLKRRAYVTDSSNMTRELYFEAVLNGHWWATACEIEAASNLLDTTINRVEKRSDSSRSRHSVVDSALDFEFDSPSPECPLARHYFFSTRSLMIGIHCLSFPTTVSSGKVIGYL